jgi:single-strand DNA-binding protein
VLPPDLERAPDSGDPVKGEKHMSKQASHAGWPGDGLNLVLLDGELSSQPVERELPSGDRLVNLEITIRSAPDRAESVPVVWLDPPAAVAQWARGRRVVVLGRVRRRFFRASGSTQSRTEVVAERVVPAGQGRRVRSLVNRARNTIDSVA